MELIQVIQQQLLLTDKMEEHLLEQTFLSHNF
jgi:hypothetical protein